MRNTAANGSKVSGTSWKKRLVAMICVAFMLTADLPGAGERGADARADGGQAIGSEFAGYPAELPLDLPEEEPAEAPDAAPAEQPVEGPAEDPFEAPAEAPADPEDAPEALERRPDAVISVNQSVALSIGRGESRVVSLRVGRHEEVLVTADGLPVVIRARNDATGAGASFRSKEEDGRWTDHLENTWKVDKGTYTLTVSAAETNGSGQVTLRVASAAGKGGGAAPASAQEETEAEPEVPEGAADAADVPGASDDDESDAAVPVEPDDADAESDAADEGEEPETPAETEPTLAPKGSAESGKEPVQEEPAESAEAPAKREVPAADSEEAAVTDGATDGTEEEIGPETSEVPAEPDPEQEEASDGAPVEAANAPDGEDESDEGADDESGEGSPEADPESPAFENTFFIENEAPLNGVKKLQNRAFKPGDSFTFDITPLEGAPTPVSKTTAADGTVIRTPIDSVTVTPVEGTEATVDLGWFHFTSDDLEDVEWSSRTKVKTFRYRITERVPADAVNADGKAYADATDAEKEAGHFQAGDFSFDARTYTVTFTVTITLDESTGDAEMTVAADRQDSALTFSNIYVGRYCVAVSKLWKDENDRDGLRPEKLYVELLQAVADGEPTVYRTGIELSDANGWTYMERGVPACDPEGRVYVYTWKEYAEDEDGARIDVVSGKITFVTGGEYALTEKVIQTVDPEDSDSAMTVTELTNTHLPETVDVRATKVWNDSDDRDGLRMDIQLKLAGTYTTEDGTYAVENVAEAVKTIAKTAEGEALTVAWTGLPKFYDGEQIVYTVTEVQPPEGYTTSCPGVSTRPT